MTRGDYIAGLAYTLLVLLMLGVFVLAVATGGNGTAPDPRPDVPATKII